MIIWFSIYPPLTCQRKAVKTNMFISAKVATWCAIVFFVSPFSGMPAKECNKPMVLQPQSQTVTPVWRIYLRLPHKLPKCWSFFVAPYMECLKNWLSLFFQKQGILPSKTFGRRKKCIRLFFFVGKQKKGIDMNLNAKKKILDSEVVRWKIPVSIGFPISFLEHNLTKKNTGPMTETSCVTLIYLPGPSFEVWVNICHQYTAWN